MTSEQLTRRQRYRRQTVAEIKAVAMAQVSEGGPEALSLNAIARGMGMSAAALYRYFDSRDELLAELAVDVHLDLAGTLDAAARQQTCPSDRLRAVADAYRVWSLAHPNAYRLACGCPDGSERILAAAQRGMNVLLAAVAQAGEPPVVAIPATLADQIRSWNQCHDHHHLQTSVLHFGLVWWSRLHGLISLELSHRTAATGISPALLYHAEIETMLDSLRPVNQR